MWAMTKTSNLRRVDGISDRLRVTLGPHLTYYVYCPPVKWATSGCP